MPAVLINRDALGQRLVRAATRLSSASTSSGSCRQDPEPASRRTAGLQCRSELGTQKCGYGVQRRRALVEGHGEATENVGNTRGDLKRDRRVGFGSARGYPQSIVEEDLVRSSLHEQRRQAGEGLITGFEASCPAT